MPCKQRNKFDLIYIAIAIPGRASATPNKEGDKQPVVCNVPVKGQQQDDACKDNQSSNRCLPTIRYTYPFLLLRTAKTFLSHMSA
jgi:hypothetical protein